MIDTMRGCFIARVLGETARCRSRMRVEDVAHPHLVSDEVQPGATEVRHPVTVCAQMPANRADHTGVRHDKCRRLTDMSHEKIPCCVENPINHLVDRFEPGRTEIAFEIARPFVADLIRGHSLPFTGMSLTPPRIDARLIEIELPGDDRCGLGGTHQR